MSERRGMSSAVVAVAAITTVAFCLRVVGIGYGLPAVYNPDEIAILARALSFAKGTLNPHNFLYPTLYFYVLFGWVGLYLAFVWVSGQVGSIAELQGLYFSDPAGLYIAGRALSVIVGTATVVALHRLALRLFDSRVALAAAVFLAVAPLHVRDSHYIKHDVPATFVVVLAYLAMTRVWPTTGVRTPSPRDVLIAGGACGIAFATHYYCVFLAAPLLWVILRAYAPLGWRAVAVQAMRAAAVCAVVFFALSPFLLVEPATAWRDITANRQIVVDRAVTGGAFAPALRYVNILVMDATGAPVAIVGIAGALWMLVASPGRAVLLLAFAVPFFAFISNTVPASRYLNAILPMITIFAAWTLSRVADRFRAHPWIVWVVVALCAVPALLQSVRSDLFFRKDDTRTVARRFIEERIPPHATILIQPYSVPLTPSREGLLEALRVNLGSSDAASRKFQLQLAQTPYPEPSYRLIFLGTGGLDAEKIYVDYAELGGTAGLAPLRRLGVAYVVLKRYTRSDPVMNPLLTALDREARRVATFSPFRPGTSEADMLRIEPFLHNTDTRIVGALERPGPPLEIWQIDGSGF
jgi:hypothetical protein